MSLNRKECRSLLAHYKAYLYKCSDMEYNYLNFLFLPDYADMSFSLDEINTMTTGLKFCGTYKPAIYKSIFKDIKNKTKMAAFDGNNTDNIKVLLDPKFNRNTHDHHLACSYLQKILNRYVCNAQNKKDLGKFVCERYMGRSEIITRILKHNCDPKYHKEESVDFDDAK